MHGWKLVSSTGVMLGDVQEVAHILVAMLMPPAWRSPQAGLMLGSP